MNTILLAAVLTALLVVLSLVGIVASIVLSDRMSERMQRLCVCLLPLACCIVFFGVPFFLCLCFFLV